MTVAARGPARHAELLDGLVALFLAEGFAAFSLEDLAGRLQCSKSTLYGVAPSKEQLVAAVTREFFRRSTEQVDARLATAVDPVERIGTYLDAIAEALAPASPAFFADVQAFGPAREIYERNTEVAAAIVKDLVTAAAGPGSDLDATFVGSVAGTVMAAIQTGELTATSPRDDAAAYRRLADLIVAAVLPRPANA